MDLLATTVLTILRKYMLEPNSAIDVAAPLSDLAIDHLDMPMIVLDIEDAFDVQLSYCDEIDCALTAASLIALVAAGVAAKRAKSDRPAIRRAKRTWMSTGADR